MRLRIQNQIQLDQEVEIFDQFYEAELKEKAGYRYLIYKNEEDEKVILKFNQEEFQMTRFSTSRNQMIFSPKSRRSAWITSPMGLQEIETETDLYELGESELTLVYKLYPLEGLAPFASYAMKISWSED